MTVESPTDGEVFWAYLEEVLCPGLQPGQIGIADTLSAHQVDGGRERIEAAGATLLSRPPYSPDFHPMEQAGSKIKPQLRKTKARTRERLEDAVAEALATVPSQDACGWFRHCGYAIH